MFTALAELLLEDVRLRFVQSGMNMPFSQFEDWFREVQADAWDVGSRDTHIYYSRQEDADAAGQGVLIRNPQNPYRKVAYV